LKSPRPLVAAGGCAELIVAWPPEISVIASNLTLEELPLVWAAGNAAQ
jgi:hypothetical protein